MPIPDSLQGDNGQSRSWVHVSGWALLSGTRRTVSCIVTCQDQGRLLAALLPMLSDTMTECGYPWELIVVDRDSTDQTQKLLSLWSELPGFRWSRCDAGTHKSLALAAGLRDARGDAVILVDPAVANATNLVPGMILRWESGARLVIAAKDSPSNTLRPTRWDEANLQRWITRNGSCLPAEMLSVSLLDRQLADQVIRGTWAETAPSPCNAGLSEREA